MKVFHFLISKHISHLQVWKWHKVRHREQWKRLEITEINLYICSQLIFETMLRLHGGKWIDSSINGAGKTWKAMQKNETGPLT
jgi:hypothetical protein